MTRILLLSIFILWLAGDVAQPALSHAPLCIGGFLGGYLLLVLATGAWGRYIARQVSIWEFQQTLRRFNITMEIARIVIPVWFAAGIYLLGWRQAVSQLLPGPLLGSVIGVLVGTLPPILAWIGLWWSQFPADRALREQSLAVLIDSSVPVHAPPTFAKFFANHFRLQVLFLEVPLLLIVVGHDMGTLLAWLLNVSDTVADGMDLGSWLLSAGLVFLLAPEILRRVLHTQPLPDSPLRHRLDRLCHRTGIGYRDILLWKTDHTLGNAAVMGFAPRLRYILLSDVLLEQLPDEEIEAVFAHEVGHIVHRHMLWYVAIIFVLAMLNAGPGTALAAYLSRWLGERAQDPVLAGLMILKFFVLFGFVSRRFERQADVYAARTVQASQLADAPETLLIAPGINTPAGFALESNAVMTQPTLAVAIPSARDNLVGPYGASIFSSALRRIAVVNNIPIAARSWCHGSIATRMNYIQQLGRDPGLTTRFDRFMRWLYVSIVAALVLSSAGFMLMNQRSDSAPATPGSNNSQTP